jgi:hypothetical protein
VRKISNRDWRDLRFDEDAMTLSFAAKFRDHVEICGFYYAFKCRGASEHLIAKVVGVNVRTVAKIVSDKSKDYVTVRREFYELGEQEYGDKYYTREIVSRLREARYGTSPRERASPPRRAARARRAG